MSPWCRRGGGGICFNFLFRHWTGGGGLANKQGLGRFSVFFFRCKLRSSKYDVLAQPLRMS